MNKSTIVGSSLLAAAVAAAGMSAPAQAKVRVGDTCKKSDGKIMRKDGSVLKCKVKGKKKKKKRVWRLVKPAKSVAPAPAETPAPATPEAPPAKVTCVADVEYRFAPYTYGAVGESYNTTGIYAVLGGYPTTWDSQQFFTATLIPDIENSAANPQYPHSVKVVINGQRVGWLHNTDAALLKPVVAGKIAQGQTVTVPARVGWYNPSTVGVFLQMQDYCI